MREIYFIDTSILVCLLNVPKMNQKHQEVIEKYNTLTSEGHTFIIPLATLVETGNHIAHIDGNKRYEIADKFSKLVMQALNGEINMRVASEVGKEMLRHIMAEFPRRAAEKTSFGDVSIVEQFDDYWRTKQPTGHMKIWSLDQHLAGYEHEGDLKARRFK